MITLRQLRYLDAVATHGHFGRAAEAAAISQPALSMQIKELETTLGLELVERLPRGARLTPDGAAVVARARNILGDVRALEEFATARGPVLSGSLRLGVIPSLAPYVLPRLLTRVKRDFPGLDLTISETLTERLLAKLRQGALDLLLLALPLDDDGVETRDLFEDPFILAAAPGPVDDPMALLASEPVLLLEDGHCLRDQALSFCADRRTGGVDAFGASSLATVVQMVGAGLGVTLLPEIAVPVEANSSAVRLIRFPDPAPTRQIGLAWRDGSAREADYQAFGDLITDAIASKKETF